MDLREFLGYFDFDYDVVSPGGRYEDRIRQELVEDGKLGKEDLDKDLICLVDLQGAYLGDIGKERYPIAAESSEKIVDRMDMYVQESVYDEFTDALENRGIDVGSLSLEEMIGKCRELGVDSGEVCYPLAEAVARPESIIINEVDVQPSLERLIIDADESRVAEHGPCLGIRDLGPGAWGGVLE